MDKRKIIGISCFLIFLLLCLSLLKHDGEKVPEYDADIICHNSYYENIDDNEFQSRSNIYIYETNGYIDKIINQAITNDASSEQFLSELTDLYNQIDGISAKVDIVNNELVMEITYDYHTLDLKVFKSTVGNLLSKDSIYYNIDSLPIKVEEYKSYELENYECEVK